MQPDKDLPAPPAADDARQMGYLRAVVANMPLGVSVFDENLRLRVWNQGFIDALGLPDGAACEGALFSELFEIPARRGDFGPGSAGQLVRRLQELAQTPTPHPFELGSPRPRIFEMHGEPLAGGGFLTLYADVTEKRQCAEREQLAQKVYRHTPVGIIFTDDEYRILSINPAITQMAGYQPAELIGQTIFALFAGESEPASATLFEQLEQRGSWSGDLEISRKSGGILPAGLCVNRVDDSNSGLPAHYVWIVTDITERRQTEERMRHIAQTDALTGLPNRLSLLIRIAHLLPEARRQHSKVAMMFLDLDRFKVINDTLGHPVGDELLREVGCRISSLVRETDFVARLGGDEFVVVLPGIATAADAATVASKIIAALSAPIQAGGHELHTSPSIGISVFPDDGPDGDIILKNADTAMYHAKAAGRNNYQFFTDEMNRSAAERLNIERMLRHAIAREQMSLVFQPQIDARDGRPTGVEALLRWRHPSDGPIAPSRFIPVAEETGLIVDIGSWVLDNACAEMARWIAAGLRPLRLAVNVSARQLRRRDFCETVANALTTSGLPPELLEIEITESSVMENPGEAIHILQRLGRMGVTLAIDDFGTGYSSLAYLKLFPIDRLKIDRSFVTDIEHDLNDRSIALSTIALAHSLGLKVIAEGVETGDQMELLRSNDCDELQGYLFSKPLNAAAAFAYLHARQGAE